MQTTEEHNLDLAIYLQINNPGITPRDARELYGVAVDANLREFLKQIAEQEE